ncbi:MAG: HNH endonuclease [Chloroflexi bacterium]|nr:HNH endonuclease [Chloroflexota bacterium]
MDDYARQFTQGWVDYFRHNVGGRPTDSFWREFRPALGNRSANICWYCERQCEPASEASGKAATVDHYKPRSCFPELTYEWTNWVFSCRRCNEEHKQDKWPALGYVDPCAGDEQERPGRYFDSDMLTGEISPHPALDGDAKRKAEATIDDLGLNEIDVRFYRINWIRQFLADLQGLASTDRRAFVEFWTGRPHEFAGSTGMAIAQLGAAGEL